MLKRIFILVVTGMMLTSLLFGCMEEIDETMPTIETFVSSIAETFEQNESIQEPTEIPTEPIPQISAEITFEYQYVESESLMPYGLFTPSSVSEENPAALIIWLHGGGEVGCTPDWFETVGICRAMKDFELEGFNAYIVCPHLRSQWNAGRWTNEQALSQVKDIIGFFIQNYSINMEKIIISGHSLGGLGTLYFAVEMPEYFDKAIIMSSVDPQGYDVESIDIPVFGCVETAYSDYHFMNTTFVELFGKDNIRHYDVIHGFVPDAALTDDTNENGKSDLIEWIFE